jgi:7 transmembrane receptor (rhodopsin family)
MAFFLILSFCTPNTLYRYMTRRIALALMATGWLVGFTIAAIPVIWNKWEHALECEFDQIFYPWYMVGVITPVFSLVWLCMLFVYCRIWREVSKQVKNLPTTEQIKIHASFQQKELQLNNLIVQMEKLLFLSSFCFIGELCKSFAAISFEFCYSKVAQLQILLVAVTKHFLTFKAVNERFYQITTIFNPLYAEWLIDLLFNNKTQDLS